MGERKLDGDHLLRHCVLARGDGDGDRDPHDANDDVLMAVHSEQRSPAARALCNTIKEPALCDLHGASRAVARPRVPDHASSAEDNPQVTDATGAQRVGQHGPRRTWRAANSSNSSSDDAPAGAFCTDSDSDSDLAERGQHRCARSHRHSAGVRCKRRRNQCGIAKHDDAQESGSNSSGGGGDARAGTARPPHAHAVAASGGMPSPKWRAMHGRPQASGDGAHGQPEAPTPRIADVYPQQAGGHRERSGKHADDRRAHDNGAHGACAALADHGCPDRRAVQGRADDDDDDDGDDGDCDKDEEENQDGHDGDAYAGEARRQAAVQQTEQKAMASRRNPKNGHKGDDDQERQPHHDARDDQGGAHDHSSGERDVDYIDEHDERFEQAEQARREEENEEVEDSDDEDDQNNEDEPHRGRGGGGGGGGAGRVRRAGTGGIDGAGGRPFCRHWRLRRCNEPRHMRRYRHEDCPADKMPLITVHDHHVPRKNTLYFMPSLPTSKDTIALGLAVYNEEMDELHRTLFSLSRQRSPKIAAGCLRPTRYDHRIVLCFDGIERMSTSMKHYLCAMFPELYDLLFRDADRLLAALQNAAAASTMAPAPAPASSSAGGARPPGKSLTYIVQERLIRFETKQVPNGQGKQRLQFTSVHPDERGAFDLNISLVLKLNNRQKHNTHEWILNGFARDLDASRVFLGDTGTLYSHKCVYRLARYMEDNRGTAAVTGRQRVMSPQQQKSGQERWYSLARLYRLAQCYDYESSFAAFMGSFHMAGMLPVMPGPCVMLWRTPATRAALQWYFDMVHMRPEDQDMVSAQCLLAEDRWLNYGLALVGERPHFTALVPDAIFWFAAETELKVLAFQRRRWINGTWSGYYYLGLLHPEVIFQSPHPLWRKVVLWLLIMCQLLMFLVVGVSPALFLISLRLSLGILWPLMGATTGVYTDVLWGIAVLSYLAFVVRHRFVPFDAFLFYWMLAVNAATVVLAFSLTALAVARAELASPVPVFTWQPLASQSFLYYLVLLIGVGTLFPMFIAIFTGGWSVWYMLKSIVPFYLFLPTMVSSFGAYSVAQTHNTSWGNRPPSQLAQGAFATEETKAKIEKAQVRLREQSQAMCGVLVMLNLAIIALVLTAVNIYGIMLYIAIFVFCASIVQMLVSFAFFVCYAARSWLRRGYLLATVVACCRWRAFCDECCSCLLCCARCRRDRDGKAIWDLGFAWEPDVHDHQRRMDALAHEADPEAAARVLPLPPPAHARQPTPPPQRAQIGATGALATAP